MYRNNVGVPCILRNYVVGHEPPVDISIAEAMLATCATPPIFSPTSIEKDFATFEYVSGDVALSNPTREIIAEAHRAFGGDSTVTCLLSIGSGHGDVKAVPSGSNAAAWVEFLDRVTKDSEKTAQEMAAQMKDHTLYHRMSVDNGMDALKSDLSKDLTAITTATVVYLNDIEVSERAERCVEAINYGNGFATLEQLSK
jgi:predicted acylesterase/phospholipase RssA